MHSSATEVQDNDLSSLFQMFAWKDDSWKEEGRKN